jgi:RNA polymerase sigma-70 factor (ECF subfamily)
VPLPGSGIDHVARPAAAAALQAIAGNLDGFGGSSELMRWASKFVMSELSVRIGWLLRDAGVYAVDRGDAGRLPEPPGCQLPEPPGCQSDDRSDWPSLFAGLSRAIDMSLSRQQRTAFMSISVSAVPADVLRTSRSAVYKALFEARRTLRAALAAGGRGCQACHEDLTGLLLAFRPQDLPDS